MENKKPQSQLNRSAQPEQGSGKGPPSSVRWLLRWYCKEELLEDLEGDLEEYFKRNLSKRGRLYASIIYAIDVIKFFRSYTIRKPRLFALGSSADMMRSHLRIALRVMAKNKAFAAGSVAGLALGLVCCLFILFYVSDELRYDQHHVAADKIFRITTEVVSEGGNSSFEATSPPGLGLLVGAKMPEVQSVTRLFSFGRRILVTVETNTFYEESMYRADSSVFSVFTMPFRHGNPKTALNGPNDVVLTASTAIKYFGAANAIGKTFEIQDNWLGHRRLVVTGILEDLPENSHFRFNMLRPVRNNMWPDFEEDEANNWGNASFYTYVKLYGETSVPAFEEKVNAEVNGRQPELRNKYHVQALTDIHLHSALQKEIQANGSFSALIILSTIAIFVLIVACVNHINMATAKAMDRAREVGIRKVNGASKKELVGQFLFESVFTALIAFAIAIFISALLVPYFNELSGKNLSFTTAVPLQFWFYSLLFVAGMGLLAGLYPAFVLSRFPPSQTLRGNTAGGGSNSILRKLLVGFQFAISSVLLIATAVIYLQIGFLQNGELGFEKEHLIVLPECRDQAKKDLLLELLKQNPSVASAGSSSGLLGGVFWGGDAFSAKTRNEISYKLAYIDSSFLSTVGIEVIEYLPHASVPDSVDAVLMNETAARRLGLVQPLGEELAWEGQGKGKVVGLVKDFHFSSLHEVIEPFIFLHVNEFLTKVYVRTAGADMEKAVSSIESAWVQAFPGQPFEFFFLDEHYEQLYQKEVKFKAVISVVALVSLLIAGLGLFGLTAFAVKRRTKEIGIRKVLGASVASILALISRGILATTLVSGAIAIPLSYVLMNRWLSGFAYRIDLQSSWWVFIAAVFSITFLAAAALVSQSIGAAQRNPVESLRTE